MTRWQRVYLAACAGVVAYALMYVAVDYARIPRLFHFQHERRFEIRERVGDPLPAGYVGLWLWALAAGAVAAAVVYLGLRLRKREVSGKVLGLAMAWALTALVIAGAYYTWNNWP